MDVILPCHICSKLWSTKIKQKLYTTYLKLVENENSLNIFERIVCRKIYGSVNNSDTYDMYGKEYHMNI